MIPTAVLLAAHGRTLESDEESQRPQRYLPYLRRAGSRLSVIRQRAARPNLQPLVTRADHGMIRPEGRSRGGLQ